jgi:hypothetical protein
MEPVAGKKQKINAYIIFILVFVGLGSLSYGYAAAVIGITLGKLSFAQRLNIKLLF